MPGANETALCPMDPKGSTGAYILRFGINLPMRIIDEFLKCAEVINRNCFHSLLENSKFMLGCI